jgi:hypothetical protein
MRMRGRSKFRLWDFIPLTSHLGFWASMKDDFKFKGKISEALRYEDIEKIFILRCYMHIPGREYLERSIRASIPAECHFSLGPVPEGISRNLRTPLLTALLQTKKGGFGLLTIYPGMTIIELNDRCGMVLEKAAEK